MQAILPINPDSNAEQIQTFIDSVKDIMKSAQYEGILKHGMDISYNESYFGEKEGQLKSSLNEARQCFNGIGHYLDEIVVEDATAYDKAKEAMRGVFFAVSCVKDAMGIATGRYAMSEYDPGNEEDKKALAARMKTFFESTDKAEEIFNSALDSKGLIQKLEVLHEVAKGMDAEPHTPTKNSDDVASVESEEEEEETSESEEHVGQPSGKEEPEEPELEDPDDDGEDDKENDDVFSEMKEWIADGEPEENEAEEETKEEKDSEEEEEKEEKSGEEEESDSDDQEEEGASDEEDEEDEPSNESFGGFGRPQGLLYAADAYHDVTESNEGLADLVRKVTSLFKKKEDGPKLKLNEGWDPDEKAVKEALDSLERFYLNDKWLENQVFVEEPLPASEFSHLFFFNGSMYGSNPIVSLKKGMAGVDSLLKKTSQVMVPALKETHRLDKDAQKAARAAQAEGKSDAEVTSVTEPYVEKMEKTIGAMDKKLPGFPNFLIGDVVVDKDPPHDGYIGVYRKENMRGPETLPPLGKDGVKEAAKLLHGLLANPEKFISQHLDWTLIGPAQDSDAVFMDVENVLDTYYLPLYSVWTVCLTVPAYALQRYIVASIK